MSDPVNTDMRLSVVCTPDAPAAIGPYSQAIRVGNMLYCSGCIPLNPVTKDIAGLTASDQAKQALCNLRAILQAGGSDVGKVVKTTVFLQSMNDFATVNAEYEKFFGEHKPARSTVEVAGLPLKVRVEIECIALCDHSDS